MTVAVCARCDAIVNHGQNDSDHAHHHPNAPPERVACMIVFHTNLYFRHDHSALGQNSAILS